MLTGEEKKNRVHNMRMSLFIKVVALRVNSVWWDIMMSNGAINTSETGEKTYKDYPVILDDTVCDIKFDFETELVEKSKDEV